jgi:hypothetical protein
LPVGNPEIPAAARYNAATDCLALFHTLSGIHFDEADPAFIHQVAVDCYGAQHAGGQAKPIAAVFSLVGLCLHLEHGFTGKQVQSAHTALARAGKNWPLLPVPAAPYPVKVDSVVGCTTPSERTVQLKIWAQATWDAWRSEQMWVRSIIRLHRLAAAGP